MHAEARRQLEQSTQVAGTHSCQAVIKRKSCGKCCKVKDKLQNRAHASRSGSLHLPQRVCYFFAYRDSPWNM